MTTHKEAREALASLAVDVWSADEGIATALTCREAEAIATALRYFGLDSQAEFLIREHAKGDEEGDQHYTEPTQQEVRDELDRVCGPFNWRANK